MKITDQVGDLLLEAHGNIPEKPDLVPRLTAMVLELYQRPVCDCTKSATAALSDKREGEGNAEWARLTAFSILTRHPDVLRDDVSLNDLIDDIVAALANAQSSPPSKLPCDVCLPPNTIIRKGCDLSTLMVAFERRVGSVEGTTFSEQPVTSPPLSSTPSSEQGAG